MKKITLALLSLLLVACVETAQAPIQKTNNVPKKEIKDTNSESPLRGMTTTCKRATLVDTFSMTMLDYRNKNDKANEAISLCMTSIVYKLDSGDIDRLAESTDRFKSFMSDKHSECGDFITRNGSEGMRLLASIAMEAREFSDKNAPECNKQKAKK
ncbi:MAG: hypothetical protein LBL46_00155 [Rickettsiales bacterium]|jgi:hypothetical protein|nr:hypothetical protein [Rickettsiales bacterium]